MVTYKYTALTKEGIKVEGVVSGLDEYTAVDKIKTKYPIVLKISEVKDSWINRLLNFEIGAKFDEKALSVMCSQFGIVLESGVSIDGCLNMIAAQTKDKKLKKMLELSADDVAQGTPLSTAFEKNYPGLPVTFLETIKAGELSGTLAKSFETLQHFFEKNYKLKQKVKSALSYPMFVLVVAVVVVIVIMAFVMPKFIEMFSDLGGELPGITKVLIAITDVFKKYWMVMFGVMIFSFISFKFYTRSEKGRLEWAKFMLKAPVIGELNTLQACTEFSSTMATLLNAGLTVGDALEATSKVISNDQLSKDVHGMVEKLATGQELGHCIRQNEFFPQVLKEMTSVGEKTGELEKTLNTISNYYSNEYDYAVSKAVSKLEPAMLMFLAGFAGFIVLALYMPMFTMYNAM